MFVLCRVRGLRYFFSDDIVWGGFYFYFYCIFGKLSFGVRIVGLLELGFEVAGRVIRRFGNW